jgi:hypothetical protein
LQISAVIEIDTEFRYAFIHIRILYILITGEILIPANTGLNLPETAHTILFEKPAIKGQAVDGYFSKQASSTAENTHMLEDSLVFD